MTSPVDEISITNLSSDVIRKIICLGRHSSFRCLQLISPRWSALVNEHIEYKKNKIIVDNFRVHIDSTGMAAVRLRMPLQFERYFRVKSWSIIPSILSSGSETKIWIQSRQESALDDRRLLSQIEGILSRCPHIRNLELNFNIANRKSELFMITNMLKRVDIIEISLSGLVTFSEDTANTILEVLRMKTFERLFLAGCYDAFMYDIEARVEMFAEFIANAAQSAIEIVINLTDSINHLPAYHPPMSFVWRNLAHNLSNLAKVETQIENATANYQEQMRIIFSARKNDD